MQTIFITLNWNTTGFLETMIDSVESTTTETPHKWVIIDNGSSEEEWNELKEVVHRRFNGTYRAFRATLEKRPEPRVDVALVELPENVGCVLGHNLAFDIAEAMADGDPFEIVMLDTDVEIFESGWLPKVRKFVDEKPIGIVGMEHAEGEACAGAVSLDASGNWYLHQKQMTQATAVRSESVGLGFALICWPVLKAGLRFDTGYELYYKQDDDLCFQTRMELGLDVWVYPVEGVHWGSGSLIINQYDVCGHHGWTPFHRVKGRNQAYFAKKWAWALRGRRATLEDEQQHLLDMKTARRYEGGE